MWDGSGVWTWPSGATGVVIGREGLCREIASLEERGKGVELCPPNCPQDRVHAVVRPAAADHCEACV